MGLSRRRCAYDAGHEANPNTVVSGFRFSGGNGSPSANAAGEASEGGVSVYQFEYLGGGDELFTVVEFAFLYVLGFFQRFGEGGSGVYVTYGFGEDV